MARSGSFGLNPRKSYGTAQSVQNVRPGPRAYTDGDGIWLCITANGNLPQYEWCYFDPTSTTFQAVPLDSDNHGTEPRIIGIPQIAIATGEVGFIWIGGTPGGGYGQGIYGKVAASYAAGKKLYTTSTAGVADDAVAGAEIRNVVGLSTDAGSGSSVELLASGIMTINVGDDQVSDND